MGYIKKRINLIKNYLLNKKLNEFTFIKGSVKNIESLRKDGLATISYLPTQYGRQTKDFDSINMLIPILRLDNSKTNEISNIYKNKDFFMEFKTAIEFVNFILQIKEFQKGINQMAQNMEKYLNI